MSALAIVECDQKDCENYDEGYCSESWVQIINQECMSYAYEGGYEEEEEE